MDSTLSKPVSTLSDWNSLSTRERDLLATQLIKPFLECEDPAACSHTGTVQQLLHPIVGAMISIPVILPENDPSRAMGFGFSHQWRKFEPSMRLEDALLLLNRDFCLTIERGPNSDLWVFSVYRNNATNLVKIGSSANLGTLPGALVYAALSTLAT